jgi:AraC family transcriptional regulator of adaptative response/methylated-DNA-[protein]-cysteine methyltransferase
VQPLLAAIDADPVRRWRDADLRRRGIDPVRARRWFLRRFGRTFQTYCRERRMGQAAAELRRGQSLDSVIAKNGYESHSGFRSAFERTFGEPPGRARHSGAIVTTQIASPLGLLTAAAVDDGLCLLEFEPRDGRAEAWLAEQFHAAVVPGSHPWLDQVRAELSEYFSGRRREFTVPILTPGTRFQESVWTALRGIPYGATCSYADIARRVGSPRAVRAVGQANGCNRVAIIVPCHRVVNSGGRLGGYGGGLWRKQFLLDLERRHAGRKYAQ